VTVTYERASRARPSAAWRLMARPALWKRWAPHVRGARGLGDTEVTPGSGAVIVGVVPVPVTVTRKEPGRLWAWRVGAVEIVHRVEPDPRGCRVASI